MSRKWIAGIIASLVVIGSVVALIAIYDSRQIKPAPSQGGQSTSTSPSLDDSSQAPASGTSKTYPIAVYFSKHTDSDNDPAKTFSVIRTSPDSGVATAAINELLKGPTPAETSNGYFATTHLRQADSNCSGQDFKLTISSGTATLRFCKPFDHLGVVADGQAESEINATLKQFATIKKVIILNTQGDCEFNASGMNLCLQ